MSRSLILAVSLALATPAAAEITYLGVTTVSGDAHDRSGLTDVLSEGTPHNRLGGFGSGIAWTGRGNTYVTMSDRGPQDGAANYRTRFHTMEILVKGGAAPAMSLQVTRTTLLTDGHGHALVGLSSTIHRQHPEVSLRLDPEAIRVGRDGNVFIADEYGPSIAAFDREGKLLRRLAIPEAYRVRVHDANPMVEDTGNKTGRLSNRGFESLAITPDGAKLFTLSQSPLVQDGGFLGKFVRLLEVDLKSGATRQFVYPMGLSGESINELLAVNGQEFLVLERDNKPGTQAERKRVYHIDVRGATEVSGLEKLPKDKLPAEVIPVKKRLFLDLLDQRFGLAGAKFPAKIEGLTFGPDLPHGRRLLLVTSDNDFKKDEATHVWAFAVDRDDLPGFEAQRFDAPGLTGD